MQTDTDRHLSKREKNALSITTRASKKRVLANIKSVIADLGPKSEFHERLMADHAALCGELRKGKRK